MDLSRFQALTFDCYGTLIDWESGILGALRPILAAHGRKVMDAEILRAYSEIERQIQSGPYLRYRAVLETVVEEMGKRFHFTPSAAERTSLPNSVQRWRPFPDTVPALRALKQRYKLYIISNIDDDMIAATQKHLEVPFDGVITAQQVGSYKPSLRNFEVALKRIALPKEKILHVAESLFHDVVPTRHLGIANCWVNRRQGKAAASGSAEVKPDLEVKDLAGLVALAIKE